MFLSLSGLSDYAGQKYCCIMILEQYIFDSEGGELERSTRLKVFLILL